MSLNEHPADREPYPQSYLDYLAQRQVPASPVVPLAPEERELLRGAIQSLRTLELLDRLLAESAHARAEVAALRVLIDALRRCPSHSEYWPEINAVIEKTCGEEVGFGWGRAEMKEFRLAVAGSPTERPVTTDPNTEVELHRRGVNLG